MQHIFGESLEHVEGLFWNSCLEGFYGSFGGMLGRFIEGILDVQNCFKGCKRPLMRSIPLDVLLFNTCPLG